MTETAPSRNRPTYSVLIVLTVVLGLASRKFSLFLPPLLSKNAGDILYATLAFWLFGLLFLRLPTGRTALAALLFCAGIEFLKFYNAGWMVAARSSTAGALVFGHGFHVSNLICYAVGVALAVGVETLLRRRPA